MRSKAIAILALCCWATPPTLLETYRETMAVAKECSHRPACMSCRFHGERLAVDEHCYHGPKCARLEDCFRMHVEEVFAQGCGHAPACSSSLIHFNAIRRFQGLAPITIP